MDIGSVASLTTLEEAVLTAPDETARVDALNSLAAAIRFDDIPRVLALAERAERIAAAMPYPRGVAMSLRWQGWCFLHLADLDKARERLRRGLGISRRIAEPAVEADCLLCLGATFYSLADFPALLDCYLQVVRLRQNLGDRAGEADARDGVGAAYDGIDDYENALSYHAGALKLREALPDKPGLAISLHNVGGMYAKGAISGPLSFTHSSAWRSVDGPELRICKSSACAISGNFVVNSGGMRTRSRPVTRPCA